MSEFLGGILFGFEVIAIAVLVTAAIVLVFSIAWRVVNKLETSGWL